MEHIFRRCDVLHELAVRYVSVHTTYYTQTGVWSTRGVWSNLNATGVGYLEKLLSNAWFVGSTATTYLLGFSGTAMICSSDTFSRNVERTRLLTDV